MPNMDLRAALIAAIHHLLDRRPMLSELERAQAAAKLQATLEECDQAAEEAVATMIVANRKGGAEA